MDIEERLGLAALTRLAFEGADLEPLKQQMLVDYFKSSGNAGALMDLAFLDQLTGQLAQGLDWQLKALEKARLYRTQVRGNGRAKTALILAAPIHMGGNTPVDFLLERSGYDVVTYYVIPGMPAEPLPPHDVAFVAAPGDCSVTRPLLAAIDDLTQGWPGLLNRPRDILKLTRDGLPHLLAGSQGLRCPKTKQFGRTELQLALAEDAFETVIDGIGAFPLIVRPVGSHAGRGLEKVETPQALADYLAGSGDDAFFLSEFIDYATICDGMYRKYRVVFVGGQAFPCHMAISDQWKVWYMNAEMHGSAAKRLEEAAFMENFAADFGARHAGAFDALCQKVGLDYFGIDCAEDADGNLVVFEGDNALIVHDMDPEEVFPYKKAPIHKLFQAFEQMLDNHLLPSDSRAFQAAAMPVPAPAA